MSRTRSGLGMACGFLVTACFQATSTTPVSGDNGGGCAGNCGTHRGSAVGGGSGAGSGSRTASSSSAGTSSGSSTITPSSSSGSSGSSSASAGGSSSGACNGAVVSSEVIDAVSFLSGSTQPVVGADVSAIGLNGAPVGGESAATDASGAFAICVVPGNDFSTQITAPGYVTAYIEDLVPTADIALPFVPMSEADTVVAYSAVLPGFVATDSMIIAEVIPAGAQPPCDDPSGWTFSASLMDGGAITFETVYAGDGGPLDETSVATEALVQNGKTFGMGFVYDLNSSVATAVRITATKAGSGCVANDGGPFTGRVVIGPGQASFAPFLLQ